MLSEQASEQACLALGHGWSLIGQGGAKQLHTSIRFSSVTAAEQFIVASFAVIEELDHHPSLTWMYQTVEIATSTHIPLGITTLDVTLAQGLTELAKVNGASFGS